MKNQIVKEEGFRSGPDLREGYDMLRVILDIKLIYKYQLKNFIDELEKRTTEEREI